jgi:antitoxin YefM
MERASANSFRDKLKSHVDRVIASHRPLHVTRRRGGDFVVLSLEDFEAEQETLAVLKDENLMAQLRASLETMKRGTGRPVDADEL